MFSGYELPELQPSGISSDETFGLRTGQIEKTINFVTQVMSKRIVRF